MEHKLAQKIFLEIRDRPYEWSTEPNQVANNCYFKGIELLQRLGILGYSVRGRVGETYLDTIIPKEISKLYPKEFLLTHFWVEILLKEEWHILDASYDPGLKSASFTVNEWESNETCFDITKVYTQEEAIAYQAEWENINYIKKYFNAISPCAKALNNWFKTIRNV